MRLPAILLFLSLTAFVGNLFGAAFASPGILARCSNEGLQTLADAAVKQLRGRLNEGMQVSDLSGSISSYGGSGDYSLTDIKITNVNLNDLTVRVNPGSGLTVSVGKMEALIKGNFRYTYKLWFIPTSNEGTFTLTIRGASIAVEVTVGMSPDGQPAVEFRDCSASVENLDLSFEANFANWIVNRFTDTVKEKIKPTLKDAVCDAIKNSRNLIAEVVAKNTKPCLQGNSCDIRIDLSLVSPPVFGENYIETSHRGEIFWKNDTGLAPYEALPFETLPPSKKMVDLYFNAYVTNTALYALHQNDLLTYKFTTSDQPEACPNVLATSCSENSSLCIGSIFASVFARFPNAFVELNFITASPPFVSMFNDSLSVVLSLQANVSIRNANGSIIDERSLFVGGIVEGKLLFNPDALLDFTIANVTLTNATISGTETGRDLFESKDSDAISRLQIIVKECIVPAIIASKQSGLSVTYIGGFHTKNRSLMLIPNATVVTFDAFYSNE